MAFFALIYSQTASQNASSGVSRHAVKQPRSVAVVFRLILVFLLVICAVVPVFAQDAHWETLNTRVKNLYTRERYAEALPIAEELLQTAEEAWGPNDTRVAMSLQNLASIRSAQNDFAAAEPLAQHALKILEAAPSPEPRKVARALNTLASVYMTAGKLAEAESFAQRALQIQEKALLPDDPDLGETLAGLASLYQMQFKYAKYGEMEEYYKRAIAILEKANGPRDPLLATVLGDFARVYSMSGRDAQAVPLFAREVAIKELILGPDNPHVFLERCLLASAQSGAKQYADAEQTYKRIVISAQVQEGSDRDFRVSGFYDALGGVQHSEGKDAEAEDSSLRAVQIIQDTRGPQDPEIMAPLGQLARLYNDEKKYPQAEGTYKRLLAVTEKNDKPQSPRIVMTLDELIKVLSEQGKLAEAEPYYLRSIEFWDRRTQTAGAIAARERYAELLRKLNREPEAIAVDNQIKELRLEQQVAQMKDGDIADMKWGLVALEGAALQQGFGTAYSQAADSLADYATILRLKGRTEEAKNVAARAQSMREHGDYAGPESFAAWLIETADRMNLNSPGSVQHERVADSLENAAGLLGKVNRRTDASILDAKAKAMRAGVPAARP
ncbi:MAG TPA: tetratricopeptide repeat protein [Candidatus Acidoferrales bacterium]